MKGLRLKLLELKKHRETIKREDDYEKRSMKNTEDEIRTLEATLGKRSRQIEENEARLAKYDELLKHSKDALAKLTENTKRLENVITTELDAMKI